MNPIILNPYTFTVTTDASEASEKARAQSFQEAPETGKADVEEAPDVMMVNWLV